MIIDLLQIRTLFITRDLMTPIIFFCSDVLEQIRTLTQIKENFRKTLRNYGQIAHREFTACFNFYSTYGKIQIKLLENYTNNEKNNIKTTYYEMMMVKIIQEFQNMLMEQKNKQLRNLSKNRKKIVAEILQYLQKYKTSGQKYNQLKDEQHKNETTKLDGLIKNIYKYYENHNLDQAYELICQLNNAKQSLTKSIILEDHQNKIKKIEKEYYKMIKFYSQLTNYGWIQDSQQENMKMYYKVFQEEKTIAVKIEAQLQIEMLPFLAIINEIELQHTYVPFTYLSQLVKVLGRNKRAAYSKVYVPLLTDRECYYYAAGHDRMSTTESIFVYSQSFDQDQEMKKEYSIVIPPAQQSKYVRLKVDYFCIDFKPISKNKAKVVLATKTNFKLTFLPLFILQKSARIFTFDFFKNIVKNAKNYKGSLFEQKVNADPSLYIFFQSKVDEYLK